MRKPGFSMGWTVTPKLIALAAIVPLVLLGAAQAVAKEEDDNLVALGKALFFDP